MFLSKYFIPSVVFILMLFMSAALVAGENVITDKQSFAQEYDELGQILEKIQDKESAILYKPEIIQELDRIKSSVGKQSDYESLSDKEKKIFVKKFQNNNLHCGYVTKVLVERNRLLLNKEAKAELGDLLNQLVN